jgi:DNA (cytosine-5)-methyltransferase 1
MRPRLLDLFCCQGGASAGYAAAGFAVVGVDINPQPRYPFEFVFEDALDFLWQCQQGNWMEQHEIAAIHASPPCQAHSNAQKIQGREHPELIAPVRELLRQTGLPYVIENVPGAPLIDPIELCGSMFGLRTYRHRLFESNVPLATRLHPRHVRRQVKMGRAFQPGEQYQAVGHFAGAEHAARDMGVEWMTRDGVRECIPPAYTHFVGEQIMAHLRAVAA